MESTERRRRPWWTILGSIVALALLVSGYLLLGRHRAKSALVKYEQQLRAKGERLNFDELAGPVSPAGNEGPELFRLCSALQDGMVLTANAPPIAKMIASGKALVIARQKEWLSSDRKKSFPWEQVEADLKLNAEPLENLREILRRPALQFPLNYRGANTLLPHLAKYKRASQWLSASSVYNLHAGHVDAAIDDAEAVSLLARPLNTEPFLISQLVRLAVATIAFNARWEILQSDALTESHLFRLQHLCERIRFIDPMILGLQGDRVMCRDSIRRARSSQVDVADLLRGYAGYAPLDSDSGSAFYRMCHTVMKSRMPFAQC